MKFHARLSKELVEKLAEALITYLWELRGGVSSHMMRASIILIFFKGGLGKVLDLSQEAGSGILLLWCQIHLGQQKMGIVVTCWNDVLDEKERMEAWTSWRGPYFRSVATFVPSGDLWDLSFLVIMVGRSTMCSLLDSSSGREQFLPSWYS